eukprot:TRINITY_DN750_c0_g1_i1.p1 TRINITY_DN750_c0_g1~~TRINITY_DN750_c0_g1_i1.p1  ORF type:complete len:624 (-),score=287.85 TRINITY_DN750_c0_g1_i1:135-2006(-)
MPWPQNYETAKEVEQVVRKNGAIPATIAILDGQICIGLNDSQLQKLAKEGRNVMKASRRDLAVAVGLGKSAATTVSATSLLAHKAGIKIFATGGIGGVHREGEITLDISADLTELGRTPICVVSAGAKSLLDIGRTLEYLETQGVAVLGFKTNDFPAFYVPSSGFQVSQKVESISDCASILYANFEQLNLQSGILIAVPIESQYAAEAQKIEDAIQLALNEAKQKNVIGKDVTPFILERLNTITGGESLTSNIALIKNNAKTAAQIACELSKKYHSNQKITTINHNNLNENNNNNSYSVVIIGGAAVDIVGKPNNNLQNATSVPGTVIHTTGGVARNIAESLHRLNNSIFFISAIGKDASGDFLLNEFKQIGMNIQGLYQSTNHSTAQFLSILDQSSELTYAIAAMDIFEQTITLTYLNNFLHIINNCKIVVIDANIHENIIHALASYCKKINKPIWFEPTSVPKSRKCLTVLDKITFISPSKDELIELVKALNFPVHPERIGDKNNINIEYLKCLIAQLLTRGIIHVILKLGKFGVLVGSRNYHNNNNLDFNFKHFHALPVEKITSVNGAGDSLVAGCISHLIKNDDPFAMNNLFSSIEIGLRCAQLTLQSPYSVSPLLQQI